MKRTYFVYIVTNPARTVLYIGMTNGLTQRLQKHYQSRGNPKTFAGRYYCYKLVYYEVYATALEAIEREKQLKKWSRTKKEALIARKNPD